MEWEKYFRDVADFRLERSKLHKLSDILMLSLCAVLSGAEDFEEIAEYGRQKEPFLRQFLELPNGIPSHDTINRVFNRLDKDSFASCLYNWSRELLGVVDYYHLSIDGKVLRATGQAGKKNSGICLVSAWAQEHQLVLGQERVESKSNEKTAIPELLESLDLQGAVVSIDAMGCHEHIAKQIKGKEAEYLLALKKNQKGLYEQVNDFMQARKEQFAHHQWSDFGSGRIEKRVCYVCQDLTFLEQVAQWPGIERVVLIESSREKDGKIIRQTRYYLTSLKTGAKEFNFLVRSHWGIENKLHWMLDVVFAEDTSRVWQGAGPENMATLRKMALQALNQQKDKKSMKARRKMAAWNDVYLMEILQNLNF